MMVKPVDGDKFVRVEPKLLGITMMLSQTNGETTQEMFKCKTSDYIGCDEGYYEGCFLIGRYLLIASTIIDCICIFDNNKKKLFVSKYKV